MANPFVWYELMTSDPAGATAFYADVIGWNSRGGLVEGVSLLLAGDHPVADVMAMPERAKSLGARPAWVGYIGVADVAAAVQALQAAGGAVYRQPFQVPAVGTLAVVADPQGAMFMLITPEWTAATPAAGLGHIGWHELYTNDVPAALDFYAALYGWTKAAAFDMGNDGIYQTFATGDRPRGGMMKRPDHFPAPHWLYYFTVESTETALSRTVAAGGKILNGPEQVPGGGWIAQALDPQGAVFALLSSQK